MKRLSETVTSLLSRKLAHGFVELEHDTDDADGLLLQAAAHSAIGYALLPRNDVEALHAALGQWLHDTTPLANLTRREFARDGGGGGWLDTRGKVLEGVEHVSMWAWLYAPEPPVIRPALVGRPDPSPTGSGSRHSK